MGCLQSENFAQTIARATYARNPRSALALLTIFRKTVAACDPQIAAVHAAKPNEVHGCGKPIVAHLTDSGVVTQRLAPDSSCRRDDSREADEAPAFHATECYVSRRSPLGGNAPRCMLTACYQHTWPPGITGLLNTFETTIIVLRYRLIWQEARSTSCCKCNRSCQLRAEHRFTLTQSCCFRTRHPTRYISNIASKQSHARPYTVGFTLSQLLKLARRRCASPRATLRAQYHTSIVAE